MPRAVVNTITQHYDLKTLDEAYVELRRMPYGDWLHRSEIAFGMQMQGDSKNKNNAVANMNINQLVVAQFEFGRCIVDHNLEDENGNKLDFRNINTLQILDPRIGNEIGELIASLHEFDEAK